MNSSCLLIRSCWAWAAFTLLSFSTLAQDNSPPEVYIGATVAETLEPAPDTRVGPGEFTITRIGSTNQQLVLFVEFSGTATLGQDYENVSSQLVMLPGERTVAVRVQPLEDSAVEGDETVIVTLSTNSPGGSTHYSVHPRLGQATVVLRDNDFPDDRPVVSIGSFSGVLEFCPPNADCAGILFFLRRTGPALDHPLTVALLYEGTATAEVDYQALPKQATFEPGSDRANVGSIPIDDTLFEGDETIIAHLVEGAEYYVDPNRRQATTVIRDNEPPAPPLVSLELVQPDAMETSPFQNAAFWAEFRVVRTGPATNQLVVFLETRSGSAKLGEDYRWEGLSENSTVGFPAGVGSVNVRLYPIDDDLYEGDETAFPRLVAPPLGTPLSELYTIDNAHSFVALIIHDNDPPPPSAPPLVWMETVEPATSEPYPSGLVVPGKFLISRTGPTNGSLSVFLQYGGTASNGLDYRELPRWFVDIPAGRQSALLEIVGLPDTLVEGKETVDLKLLPEPPEDFPLLIPIQQYRLDTNRQSGRVIIFDRQTPLVLPTLSIEATAAESRECPLNAICPFSVGRLTIRRTGELDYPLPIHLAIEGTAIRGVDYALVLPDSSQQGFSHILTLPAGQSRWDLVVNPIDDVLAEDDETVSVRLLSVAIDTAYSFPPADYNVEPDHAGATVTIHDNDPFGRPVVSLELIEREAAETRIDQNAIVWAEFRVLRTGAATNDLVVYLNTQQGSARLGVDYSLDGVIGGSTVRFPAGARSVIVRLYPIDDDFYEGDETVFFHLLPLPPGIPMPEPYEIEYARSAVSMVIHDNDPVTNRLDITAPRDGQRFEPGDVIELRAQIIGPDHAEPWSVEFFDGTQSLGSTRPGGTIWWQNASGGEHVINARAYNPAGIPGNDTLDARPVTIQVGPGPAWPVVSITTSRWPFDKTAEPCPTCLVVPGVLRIARTGPVNEPLKVYLQADGTAAPGADYQPIPPSVTIPAGTNSTQLLVLPLDDLLAEGPEVVRASLTQPPEVPTLGYLVNVHASEAFVVIGDGEPGAPQARLDIIAPQNGAHFAAATTVTLSALGVFTQGEVVQPVEFYAGDTFIGRSSPVQFERPFIPCLPSIHTFLWTNAPPGLHVLTARSELSLNEWVQAPPVTITVGGEPPRIAITRPASGTEFSLDTAVEIVADTRDLDGYVSRVEFFADARKIGESSVVFVRPPEPGHPQTFTFLWRQATPGAHALTARATDNTGTTATSEPVPITVATSEPLPIVRVTAPDAFAVEPGANTPLNTATFRIIRSGPITDPLVVAYSLDGIAQNGIDYETLSGLATIPARQRWGTVVIRPLTDSRSEGSESVLLRLEQAPSPNPGADHVYRVGRRNVAAAVVSDGPRVLSLGEAQCVALSGSLLHVGFEAEAGYNFRLEATADFTTWETLFDTPSLDGTWHFIDTEMKDHPRRFYRLTPEPVLEP